MSKNDQIMIAAAIVVVFAVPLVNACGKSQSQDCETVECSADPGGSSNQNVGGESADVEGQDVGHGLGGEKSGDEKLCLPAVCPQGYCIDNECLECVYGNSDKKCTDPERPVCLEDHTCATIASQQVPFADPARISGSRLKVQYVKAADGSFMSFDFWDTHLKMTCSFRAAQDGATRCLPRSRQALDVYFVDEACTQPFVEVSPGCDSDYALASDTLEVFRRTDQKVVLDGYSRYGRSGADCQEYSIGVDHDTFALELVPSAEFVLGEVREEPRADGLVAVYLDGNDGSSILVGVNNADLGYGCVIEHGYCLPASTGHPGYHLDDECTTPLSERVHSAGVGALPSIVAAGAGTTCFPQVYFFEAGDPIASGTRVYEESSEGECTEVTKNELLAYFRLGSSIPVSTFPAVRLVKEGSGDFLAQRYVDSEGGALSSVLGFWDVNRDEVCKPFEVESGEVVPLPDEYASTWGDDFSGAACEPETELANFWACDNRKPRVAAQTNYSCRSPLNFVWRAYETGAEAEPLYRLDYNDECEPRENSTSGRYYLLGSSILDELPRFELLVDD